MDLTRLRIFVAVAEEGSFAAAADTLSYTPSAVSQAMSRLEAEVDAQLMTRTGRGVVLTEAGDVLLDHAREILRSVERARHDLETIAGTRANELCIASFATAIPSVLVPAIRDLRGRHPEVEVAVRELEPFEAAAAVADRSVDLALVYRREQYHLAQDWCGRRVAPVGGVSLEPVMVDRFVLAVPLEHPLADPGVGVDARSLAGETLIGSARWPGLGTLAANLEASGVRPRFDGLFSQSYATVLSLVAAGDGVAAVPALAAWQSEAPVVFRSLGELAPSRSIELLAATGRRSHAEKRARTALVRHARRVAAHLDAWCAGLERPDRMPVGDLPDASPH